MSQCAYSPDALSWTDLPVGPQFDLALGIDEQNTELITDGGVSWTERLFERDTWNLTFKIQTSDLPAFQALHDAVDGQLNRFFLTLDRTADPIVFIYGWKEAGFALEGTGEPVQPPIFNYRLSMSGETMSILALIPSYSFADLPADPAAGTLARVTDDPGVGSLWMYNGTIWEKVVFFSDGGSTIEAANVLTDSLAIDGGQSAACLIEGTHQYGIKAGNGTFAISVLQMPNDAGITGLDSADVERNVIKIDATDDIVIGWAGASSIFGGTVDAPSYAVSGVAGIDFGPGAPTSITIRKGIVTACS